MIELSTDMAAEIASLRRQVEDLRLALQTSNEHADINQEHLFRMSEALRAEVRERQATEERLQAVLSAVAREKCDLEILVQILTEQGDQSALEGEQARLDGLTQIANRRRLDEFLALEWERRAAVPSPLSLLICDVDHFKNFNDSRGHPAGDACLQLVAKVIGGCFRPGDVVARYGGEEFAVVLPRTDRTVAERAAERARVAVEQAAIAHPASSAGEWVTISIGAACAEPGGAITSVRELLAEADRNLYLAKRAGRNRVHGMQE